SRAELLAAPSGMHRTQIGPTRSRSRFATSVRGRSVVSARKSSCGNCSFFDGDAPSRGHEIVELFAESASQLFGNVFEQSARVFSGCSMSVTMLRKGQRSDG